MKDLEVLGGTDVSLACKRDTIIVRMLRCGLHLPAEAAWREVIRSAQASLKQRVRNTEKPEPFIEAFSGDVSKIPASADTDSPLGKRLSDASHLGQWMPVRKSSNQVNVAAQPSSSSSAGPAQAMVLMMHMFQQFAAGTQGNPARVKVLPKKQLETQDSPPDGVGRVNEEDTTPSR